MYAYSGSIYYSNINLSNLFNTKIPLSPSLNIYFNTVYVWLLNPSKTSINISAPSVNLNAAYTSDENSTCPGLSIRFIK